MKATYLILLLSLISISEGCHSTTSKPETTTEQQPTPMDNGLVTGEVQAVTPGKDGYTAKIISADSLLYFATISHANLKENAAQYRAVNVGEKITVKGDIWKMGEETHITVRELK